VCRSRFDLARFDKDTELLLAAIPPLAVGQTPRVLAVGRVELFVRRIGKRLRARKSVDGYKYVLGDWGEWRRRVRERGACVEYVSKTQANEQ
jgi:hypothetical protein